jgi:hypothetical protein
VGRAQTLAQVYRRFGEVVAGTSPLYDLALAGGAPALAAAYAAADGDAAAGAAIETLLRRTGPVVAIAVRRKTRGDETGRCAVLYPAVAGAAHRAGADQPERIARLDAEIVLAAADPPLLLHGDPVEVMPDAITREAAGALPVVTTTWALSRFPLQSRLRFLHRLDEAAGRAVAWVSAEGVGVAPAIPTLGDRRASGHSIIGLAVFDRPALRAEAIGRCWSRGRLLAWLADS